MWVVVGAVAGALAGVAPFVIYLMKRFYSINRGLTILMEWRKDRIDWATSIQKWVDSKEDECFKHQKLTDNLKSQFEMASESYKMISSSVTTAMNSLNSMATDLKGISITLHNIERRMDKIEIVTEELAKELKGNWKMIVDHEAKINALETFVQRLDD